MDGVLVTKHVVTYCQRRGNTVFAVHSTVKIVQLLDKQVHTENENLKIKFPGFTQALIKCDENKRK